MFFDDWANEHYDGYAVRQWLVDNTDLAILLAGLYLAFVFKGPDLIERYILGPPPAAPANGEKSRHAARDKPFLLKWTWVIWNLLLSAFSFYGSANVTPVVLRRVKTHGIRYTLCNLDETEFYTGPVGMALGLYCLSKAPELMDTAFLLLSGKKSLPFLQWFHHVTTFLFCWHAYVRGSSALYFAAALNYSVHTVMYFYFAMAEAGFKNLVKPFAMYITILQVLQMVVGTALISMIFRYKIHGECPGSAWDVARVQIFIASVNLILFSHMFLKTYVLGKKPSRADRGAAREKKVA